MLMIIFPSGKYNFNNVIVRKRIILIDHVTD
jgi:hypothetical protein